MKDFIEFAGGCFFWILVWIMNYAGRAAIVILVFLLGVSFVRGDQFVLQSDGTVKKETATSAIEDRIAKLETSVSRIEKMLSEKEMKTAVCNCGGTKVMCSCEKCECSIRKPTVTEVRSSEKLSYKEFYALALSGKISTFTVGTDIPGIPRCDAAAGIIGTRRDNGKLFTITDGQYSCWSDGVGVGIKPIEQSVPNVATPRYDPVTRYYQPTCVNGNCR